MTDVITYSLSDDIMDDIKGIKPLNGVQRNLMSCGPAVRPSKILPYTIPSISTKAYIEIIVEHYPP